MSAVERRLARAVRWTPEEERDRYEPEWRADVAEAERHGLSAVAVARGAVSMAVRLRFRQAGKAMLGGHGARPAAAIWAVVAVVLVAAFLLGGPFGFLAVVVLGVVGAGIAVAGAPSHWSHWLMVVAVVVGLGAAGFAWWLTGAMIDAADARRPAPAAAEWGGASLIMVLASMLTFILAGVIAVTRERSLGRKSPTP